jgi:hypothetical protein
MRNFDDDYAVSWDPALQGVFNCSDLLCGVENQMVPLDACW